MIGKKIGVFSDFFHISPPLTKWIVMAALQDEQFVKGGGYGGDIDDDGIDFYKKKLGDMNHIIVTMARGKLIVQLGIKKPLNNANPEDPIKHFINTKITYAIDMSTLDVYNSQYQNEHTFIYMTDAVLVLDMDFFTRPVYIGSFYEKREYLNPLDFKGTAKNWMTLDDFLYKMNFLYKIRGASVGRDQETIYYLQRMIDVHHIQPKKFELILMDAHHDSYMWNDKSHYDHCPITEFRDWDWALGTFRFGWVDHITWVYPDYLEKQEPFHPAAFSKIHTRITPVKWADFKPNEYEWKYLSLVLNKDMAAYDDKMLQGILKHIQVF